MKKIALTAATLLLLLGLAVILAQYDEWFTYPRLRAYVNDQLKDPSSTQYRNERMTKAGWLCGEMNSKNGMGGYVGYKRFIAGSADDAYVEGYGYVGKDDFAKSSELTIKALDVHIKSNEEIIRLRQMMPEYKGRGLSDGEAREKAIAEIFDEKWKQICE